MKNVFPFLALALILGCGEPGPAPEPSAEAKAKAAEDMGANMNKMMGEMQNSPMPGVPPKGAPAAPGQ